MRLAEAHIEGFGLLANRHLRFAPGFNLVFGPNDAGKSTLQQALVALLYGFLGEGPITPADEAALALLRPWDRTVFYAGSLTYTLDNGQGFRASRRFLPKPEASLRTHPKGVDVTTRFRSASHGRLCFADEHLGLSKEVFESICVARQAASLALGSAAPAIASALRRSLAAAPADADAARAVAALEAVLDQELGTPTSPSGAFSQALAALSSLEDERMRMQRALPEWFSLAAALDQASHRLEALALRRKQLLQEQEEAERSVPGTRLATAEVRRCEEEVARWRPWASFPVQARDNVLRLSVQRTHLRDECAEAERRTAHAKETLKALEAQEATVRERIASRGGAPATPSAPGSELPDIHSVASEWTAAGELESAAAERAQTARDALASLEQRLIEESKPLEAAIPLGPSGLAAARQRLQAGRDRLVQARSDLSRANAQWALLGVDEAQLRQLEAAAQRGDTQSRRGRDGRQGAPLLSALFGRIARGDSAPTSQDRVESAHENLVRCRAELEAAQRALSDIEATTFWQLGAILGGTLDDSAFGQLTEKLERHLRMAAEVEQQRITVASLGSDLAQARQRRDKAQRALQAELSRMGFDASDPHKAFSAYMKKREGKGRLTHEEAEEERLRLRAEADLELLRLRAATLQDELRRRQDRIEELANVESRLRTLLAEAGIPADSGSLEEALTAFDQGCENHRRWESAQAALETARRFHETFLAAQADAAASARADPGLPDYAGLLRQLDDEVSAVEEEQRRLEDAIGQAACGPRHLAEIDEELAAAQAEVRRLQRFCPAVQLARDEIAEASREMRQQFVPTLELWLKDALGQITDGRYGRVAIDPADLALSLQVPGQPAPVPVDRLGAGMRDLTHLLLRLSVARLMGHGKEALPLLLDEPLAQCDPERRQRAFDYLASWTGGTQIIYFTADERLRDRFVAQCQPPDHQLHTLAP